MDETHRTNWIKLLANIKMVKIELYGTQFLDKIPVQLQIQMFTKYFPLHMRDL